MVAVVTGGSRGIGKAIAEELLRKDYTVIVTARSKNSDTEEMENQYPDKFIFVPCDISDPESRKNLVAFTEEKFGKLLFINMEIGKKTFSPEIIPLLQKENALTSEYQKLYATTTVEIDGKTLPITKLSPYKQSPDREVRKTALSNEPRAKGNSINAHGS